MQNIKNTISKIKKDKNNKVKMKRGEKRIVEKGIYSLSRISSERIQHKKRVQQIDISVGEIIRSNSLSQQQIMIKNIDSGSYQIVNIQQIDSLVDTKPSTSTRLSLWNSYWQQVSKTDIKLLKLVMENNVNELNKLLSESPIELNSFTYIDGWTLLHHAVVNGAEDVANILIQHKINLNAVTSQMKRTPLHQAVLSNKFTLVHLLISNNADPNFQDTDGNTPAHYAAEMSYFDIFQTLNMSSIPLNLTLKNNQQMTIIDAIRDQRIFKFVQTQIQQLTDQNQNQLSNTQNRRFLKSEDGSIIKRYAKADIIEKFLFLNTNIKISPKGSIIYLNNNQNQFKESFQSTSSSERKKKIVCLGKKPSNWIQKRGQQIASQAVNLMKESVFYPDSSQDNEYDQSLQNYEVLRFIGSGGFAEVFLARRKKSSKLYALKRISKSKILQNNLRRYVYSQRNIMIKCSHPFIVEAHSMFQDQTYLYIAMEYCECGDLLKAVSNGGVFDEFKAKIYAAQVGLALEYMHMKKILFRDLKTANVLISKDGYVKVSDFGLAKESTVSFTFLGSIQYLAPEMVVDKEMKQHTKSIDWYLFGVLIYELLTGKPPFYCDKQQIIFKRIKQQKPIFPLTLSKQCKDLLSRLLQKDPSKRLGSTSDFKQIMSHEWFKEVNFQKLLQKSYDLEKFDSVIKENELRKKIPIDSYESYEKYQYFKSWNYAKTA